MNENILNEINDKLSQIIQLLKTPVVAPTASALAKPLAKTGALNIRGDGTASGVFKVMTEPKAWSSGKGAFLRCKIDGDKTDDWYSVGVTYTVAEKVYHGYYPKKGDVIAVTGKYEEETKEKNDGSGLATYRSLFAFKVAPDSSVPAEQKPPFGADVTIDEAEDVPF